MHRFFAPSLDPGDELVDLPREESEHLKRVLRMGVGDTVAIFDGRGHEFLAKVASVDRREVRVQVLSPLASAPESTTAITLAQAVLKGEKMDDVVRDSVMLGVVAIQPIVTRRTEVTVAALMRGARVERWRRVALASAKQSGRAVLPDIRMPMTFETWLGEPPDEERLLFVEPGIEGAARLSLASGSRAPATAACAIGPEGGWHPDEVNAARAGGLRLVTLGGRTLRADAVPIAALSVLQFLWDQSC